MSKQTAIHLVARVVALLSRPVRDDVLNLVYHLVDGLVMAELALHEIAGLLHTLLDLVPVLLDQVLGLVLQALEVDTHRALPSRSDPTPAEGQATYDKWLSPGQARREPPSQVRIRRGRGGAGTAALPPRRAAAAGPSRSARRSTRRCWPSHRCSPAVP